MRCTTHWSGILDHVLFQYICCNFRMGDDLLWEGGDRRYSMPPSSLGVHEAAPPGSRLSTSEDLHAWSIYRQNLNSDFTDSALGSAERSPLPYGNFQVWSNNYIYLTYTPIIEKSYCFSNEFFYVVKLRL